jgi:hypothetical protein
VKVTLMLADHAQSVGGKLYISGGGWSMTGPEPAPFALVLDVKVPWHAVDQNHTFKLELLDADGGPVAVETPEGPRPLSVEGGFEASPGDDIPPGMPVDAQVAFNFGPQQLTPGERYEWRLSIDGETREDWYVAFSTRAQPEADDDPEDDE